MPHRKRSLGGGLRVVAAAVAPVLALATISSASTITDWTGSADNTWSNPTNWDNGVPVSGFNATFNGAGNGNTSILLNNSVQSINAITFSGSPASYAIGTALNDGFTFDSGGAITVASGVTTAQSIAASVNASGALMISNSGTGGLTLGALTLGGTLTTTNSGSTALTTFGGNIGGTGGISVTGNGGIFLFSGNNSYSGTTTFASGLSTFTNIQTGSNTAFGTGTLQFNNTSDLSSLLAFGADRTVANQININTGFSTTNAATPHNLTLTGPIAITSTTGALISVQTTGQVTTLGSAAAPSTLTLSSTSSSNLTIMVVKNGSSAATLAINDVIQDNGTPPAIPSTITYSVGQSATGNVIINGANTYAGDTTFSFGWSGPTEIGVSSVISGSSIISGPFGKGAVMIDSNTSSIFQPYRADRVIANPLTVNSGFGAGIIASTAPLSGTDPTVDPSGVPHNLSFTGTINLASGGAITNNMPTSVSLILGSASSPTVITSPIPGSSVMFQSTNGAASNTVINDQITGPQVNLTIQNRAIVQLTNGTSNYGGTTSVTSSAVLLATNSSGSATGTSTVSIGGTGGTLGGTGFITGPITIKNGGILAPGTQGAGTLNVGSMTWIRLGEYNFDYNPTDNTAGNFVNDLINSSGTLDLSDLSSTFSVTRFDLNFSPLSAGTPTQNYTLGIFAGGILHNGALANGTDVTNLFTTIGTLPAGADIQVIAGPGGGTSQALVVSFTPEPAAPALIGLFACRMLLRRPRKHTHEHL